MTVYHSEQKQYFMLRSKSVIHHIKKSPIVRHSRFKCDVGTYFLNRHASPTLIKDELPIQKSEEINDTSSSKLLALMSSMSASNELADAIEDAMKWRKTFRINSQDS